MRVLFVSGIGGDTRRYRCLHHQEQLALQGIESTLRVPDDVDLYVDILTHDLLVLHRVAWQPVVADIVAIAHQRGFPVIFETDDLVFDPDLFGRIGYIDTLTPADARRFLCDVRGQVEALDHCDAVLTTTEYLSLAANRAGKRAFVQRNAFSREMIAAAEAAYPTHLMRRTSATEDAGQRPVVVGYFSGTGSHNRDFAQVVPVLAELLERYPNLWLHLSGHLELGAALSPFQARIRRAPYVAWQELPHLIAQVDVNLAPLELDNPFCQAKSEIKYTEAALVAVPTIASPTESFCFAIEHGVNGLLAATPSEWRASLTQLIEEPATRQRIGEAARARVYDEYVPERCSQQLVETLRIILAEFEPHPALDQVPFTVAQGMKREIERLAGSLTQQENRLHQLRQTLAEWESTPLSPKQEYWKEQYETHHRQTASVLRAILSNLQSRRIAP